MNQLNKKELIKNFIVENKDRFILANDIFEHFKSITDDILKNCLEEIVRYINKDNQLDLFLMDFGQMANYYYFNISLNLNYYLQFECYYYFKTYRILLRDKNSGPFDPNNGDHLRLRDLMKKEFQDTFEGNHYISGIKNSSYEMNISRSYIDLFDVYDNNAVRRELCDNFSKRFAPKIKKILNLLEP